MGFHNKQPGYWFITPSIPPFSFPLLSMAALNLSIQLPGGVVIGVDGVPLKLMNMHALGGWRCLTKLKNTLTHIYTQNNIRRPSFSFIMS